MAPNPLGIALRRVRAGQHKLAWAHPELQAAENFSLSSPAFIHGAPMPKRHAGKRIGDNISPGLAWSTPPAEAAELILVVQDPDVPFPQPIVHALTAGIDPALGQLPENGISAEGDVPGIKRGKAVLGHRGWVGPTPIPSHGAHAYVFQMFALDRRLDLPDGFSMKQALDAMSGHVIGRARLDGSYEVK
jgi:Raf kinase inhibitor-like YbhB/YbcL family protein